MENKRNILSVDEAWEQIFERQVSKYKFYAMLRQGKIPCVRMGNRYILRRDTLEKWMADQENQNFNREVIYIENGRNLAHEQNREKD